MHFAPRVKSNHKKRIAEITQLEYKKKTNLNEDSIRDLGDSTKHTSICIIGVPEGEERKKGVENLLGKIMVENFPNQGRKQASRSRRHRESQT